MSIKKGLFFLLGTSAVSLLAMQCTDFGEFKQYGAHYYALSGTKFTFAQAKQIAENNGGYIAIPNDAGENNFLATTFGTAWIGVYDPSLSQLGLCYSGNVCTVNASRFSTVKNTSLSYSNWANGEPNNAVYEYDIIDGKQMVAPLGEHWVVIGENSQWGSFGNHAQESNNPVQFKAIFEFDTKPECVVGGPTSEPATERKCTDTIYNTGSSTAGQIVNNGDGDVAMTTSNTYTCQNDTYGNEYCPTQLAKCDEVWGYQDGYSVSHEICGDGTQPINGLCKSTTKACDAVGGTWNGKDCTVSNSVVTSADTVSFLMGFAMATSRKKTINGNLVTYSDFSRTDGYVYSGGYAISLTYDMNDTKKCPILYWVMWGTAQTTPVANGTRCGYDFDPTHLYSGEIYPTFLNVTTTTVTSTVEPSCSNVSSDGYCYSSPMTYYTYHCSTTTNEYGQSYIVQNAGGIGTTNPTPPTNNCKIESFSCVPATDRKCAFVSNQWQCSPFPCFGESNLESADTTVGELDSSNKGFNTDGSCSYQIRLFNGKDMRCRSWDALFGLLGGGCCQRDNGSGLGALFGGQCKEDERLLAKYRKESADRSHYVGEYCSKYLKLGFAKICIQKKKTYCVFNSKLARIIHEQGRPQINIAWGGAKAPNCKGFTPEEFQKIDFSKLDLSEFYGDLESKIKTTFDAKVGATIQQKVSSFGVNINGN